jgi:hypothetical protein
VGFALRLREDGKVNFVPEGDDGDLFILYSDYPVLLLITSFFQVTCPSSLKIGKNLPETHLNGIKQIVRLSLMFS